MSLRRSFRAGWEGLVTAAEQGEVFRFAFARRVEASLTFGELLRLIEWNAQAFGSHGWCTFFDDGVATKTTKVVETEADE